MRRWHALLPAFVAASLVACATAPEEERIGELDELEVEHDQLPVEDAALRAEQSYRRYLEETPKGSNTPEAMRRLADLQIEKVYGVVGAEPGAAMPVPSRAAAIEPAEKNKQIAEPRRPSESDLDFERRTTSHEQGAWQTDGDEILSYDGTPIPSGPLEAIEAYQEILSSYKHYSRKDRVLYQLARAYDEVGQTDQSIEVLNRLVSDYPYSNTADEVHFRRGEYYFVRKRWRDAELAYHSVVVVGPDSDFYEVGLYKLGWSLYKQGIYDEALDNFVAVLDHRKMNGYVFDEDEGDAHRVTDTFRVISLCIENLGGPEVLKAYFEEHGNRSYEDKIYANLGEYYFAKLRYDDAATVYGSFVDLYPKHKKSPQFSRRAVEIFERAGFPRRVVEAKKEFSARFALSSDYWVDNELYESPDVIEFLRTNLVELASYYHALYQDPRLTKERQANFDEAQYWYRQLLTSSPAHHATPQAHYRLADLLLENNDFVEAAIEYEHAAYDYGTSEWADDAAYAAIYSYRQELKVAEGGRRRGVMKLAAKSSLRFADAFPGHQQVPNVLVNAADDFYEVKDFALAIEAARKLNARYPHANSGLRRSAWSVIAHSSMEVEDYVAAERAYTQVLALTSRSDKTRSALADGLAAAIYKQGEQAVLRENHRAAVDHFVRIQNVEASSEILVTAEYAAAAARVGLQEWSIAAADLEAFRTSHSGHVLADKATKQLAYVYNEIGEIKLSAAEHEKLAANATDPEVARDELLLAGDLYEQTGALAEAARVYEQYVQQYPEPLDINMDTRSRIAEIHKNRADHARYHEQLEAMVAMERDVGAEGGDRIRLLAANAALVLAERSFDHFARQELAQPFDQSLPLKQDSMDQAIAALEQLVDYEIAEVTAAATYYLAETYMNFSQSLLESERPTGMTSTEMNSYELMIEEEAFPFEEQAIAVHEANYELMLTGVYNPWIQRSLDELAAWMPARYAKREISEGLLHSVDSYTYQPPGTTRSDADVATPADADKKTAYTIAEPAPVSDELRTAFKEAIALLDVGEQQRGIEMLTLLTSQAPMVMAPRINLGIAYHIEGDLDAAEEHLSRAVELAAGHPAAHTELGIIYRKTGRFADAKRSYETALAVFPRYHHARLNLAILCDLYLADTECALQEYESYMAAIPDDDQVAMWIEDVSNRMGL